jgi:mono/diheme cytochrome c family protein
MRLRHGLSGLLGVILLGAAGFFYFAHQPAIPSRPASTADFDAALIAKGAELAMIGNCNVCHSQADGLPYAGGRPIATPFGTIYATNITPDPETGIGQWSEAAFLRAMQEGVSRDGAHLYPVFPYDHFTKVSTEDLRSIYAFLMTRAPVRAATPPNALPFPYSVRYLIAGWKLLFFKAGPLKPDPTLTAEINRGFYLVEGLAHCGACHTPRNALGAERYDHSFAGGEAEDWHAPALNAASTAPVPWTAEQLFTYLRQGFVLPHGVAAGPMQAVSNNLGTVPERDVKAIAAYVGAIVGPPTADRRERARMPAAQDAPQSASRALRGQTRDGADGAIIYAGACATCHEATGQRFSAHGIHLASSKVIAMPDPRNLAHVILEGIRPPLASPSAEMPGFADALSNRQVAALMSYLRSTFSDHPPWEAVEEQVRTVRSSHGGS